MKSYTEIKASQTVQGQPQIGIKRILFPTDFSKTAENAFDYAMQMADYCDASIDLLYVYPDTPIDKNIVDPSFLTQLNAEREAKADQDFQQYMIKVEEAGKTQLQIRRHIEKGNASKVIAEKADALLADLIIMGTLGESSVQEQIFGSITTQVIYKSHTPVLAIPANASFKPVERIMCGIEMNDSEWNYLDQLTALAKSFGASLLCGHIQPKDSSWNKVELNAYRKIFDREEEGTLSFYLIYHRDLIQGIRKFVIENEVDMVAMITHPREGMKEFMEDSQTRKMILASRKTPILVLKEEDNA